MLSPAESAAGSPALPPRLLLVEDDPAIRELTESILRREGVAVTAVATGEDALACLQSEPYDCLMADHHLPGGYSGCDIIAAAREIVPGLPALLATGGRSHAADWRRIEGMAPEVRILTKPFRRTDLIEALHGVHRPAQAAQPEHRAGE